MRLRAVSIALVAAACGGDDAYTDAAAPADASRVDAAEVDAAVDLTPPETTITAAPDDPSSVATATFEFEADEPAAFECTLDGAAFATCTSPHVVGVTDGAHTFAVRATDLSGNVEPDPELFVWATDTVAPETTITGAPPLIDNSVDVTITFDASEPAGFECALDGAAFAACTSPHALTGLADGAHAFMVRAIDLAGNVDPTPASHDWTIDSSTPDTTIDGGPSGAVSSLDATFTFSSPDAGPGATFECALDAAGFAACTSPHTLTGLAEGAHSFQVRVRDVGDNVDPTPATRVWTADVTSPDTSIDDGPLTISASNDASLTFSSSDAGASFECSLDGAAFAVCTSPFVTMDVADGPHTLAVRAIDAAGNFDVTPAFWNWTVDTVAPDSAITSGPSGPSNDPAPSFTFTASELVSFTCSLDAGAYAPCTSPLTLSGLADGAHTLAVRATDLAGNAETTPATRTWTIDTVAPDTTILTGPSGVVPSNDPSFTFSGSGASVFECRVDAGPFTTCTSPHAFTDLTEGAHTFEVRGRDAADNVDATPASRSWTIDTVVPDTTIVAAPDGTTADNDPQFSFTASEPGTFECNLDGIAWAACTSPRAYIDVGDGAHTFGVRALDGAGNPDATPATHAWTIDTAAPDTTISAGPSGVTALDDPVFAFSSGEPGATFECRLDGAAFAACTSPKAYNNVADGAHTFEVRARDVAGNVDGSPASRTWTIDTVAPDTTITLGPSGTTGDDSPTFTFTSELGTTYQCNLDGSGWLACTSPRSYTNLGDGGHTFDVRAIDGAGNVDPTPATRTWTIDTDPPETILIDGPSGTIPTGDATFTFTADEPTGFECRLDGAAFAACTSPRAYTGLAEGSHAFEVRAIDGAGNLDTTPALRTWTIDTMTPDTTISAGPSGTTLSNDPVFSFSSEPGATFECRLDGGSYAVCVSPRMYFDLADGAHSFDVRAIDGVGNVDPTPATRAWTIDTLASDTTITAGPEGTTASNDPDFSFLASESGSSFECRLDGSVFATCTSPQGYTGLADGAHTFDVRAIDGAGNVDPTPATRTWTIDTDPPETILIGGPSGPTATDDATFTFTADEQAAFECRLDGAAFAACTSPHAYTALEEGSHSFEVRAIDDAGNVDTTPTSRVWIVDTQSPDTTISAGPSGTTPSNDPVFSFTSEPGATFECRLDGGAYAICVSPDMYFDIADGTHSFEVRAIDGAGNVDATPATRSWTIDTIAPTVTITSGPSGTVSSTNATFTFTTPETDSTFECRLDGAVFAVCTSPHALTNLAEGTHTFGVRGVDAVGNLGAPVSRTWTVDLTPPI